MKESLVREKKIRDTLIGYEMAIDLIENDLRAVGKELTTLKQIKKELEYNINFLKKDGIVAVASEYKKSVIQLERVSSKIMKLVTLKSELSNRLMQNETSHKFYFNEYKKIHKQLEEEKVIIPFSKRKEEHNE